MKNITAIMVACALFIGLSTSTSFARFFVPNTVQAFDDILANHDLAVVHFNPYGIGDVPEDDESVLQDMKLDFMELAQEGRYMNAGVAFIGVNTARIPALAKRYNIDPEAKATIILYKDGNEFKQAKRKDGFLTKGQMRSYVEKFFGDIIDKILAQRKPERRMVTRRYYAQPSYSYSYYPTSYYDYDYYPTYRSYGFYPGYYGYGYPFWGPGFGFNIGGGDGFGFGIGFGF